MAMLTGEHQTTALDFLDAADREFAAGDNLQGSEKMWGAAAHAVMAVAQHKGWPFGSHQALKVAADRLTSEYDDPALAAGFSVAQKFHANFYHDFMEPDDIRRDRPTVANFVARLRALTDEA